MANDFETEGKKPLRYYQNLRNSSFPFNTSTGSQIVEVQVGNDERVRLLHIMQIMPLNASSSFWTYWDVPGLLALTHFNDRSNLVVPNLSEMLGECNIYMTMDMLDSKSSPFVASKQFYSYFNSKREAKGALKAPHPAAVVGAGLSSVSRALLTLTGSYQIPQISPSSTSAELDKVEAAATFGRTVPTNTGDAEASIAYFKHLGITHFAILFVRDDYGNSFQKDLGQASSREEIITMSAGFEIDSRESIASALKIIKESGFRYIYAILHSFPGVLEQAFDTGLVGDEYTWYLPEQNDITEQGYALNRTMHQRLAAAIQGSTVIGLKIREQHEFEKSLSSLQTDPDFQNFFLEMHPDASIYKGVKFTEKPLITPFTYTAYDAVMALGIAACQADEYFFKGADYFKHIKNTTFDGASGPVVFDPVTGSRKFEDLAYSFTNVFVNETLSDNETMVFQSRVSTLIDFNSEQVVKELYPMIYSSGNVTPPLQLPELEEDLNLVSVGVFSIGWVLAGILILCCLSLGWWVCKYKNKQIIRASQPFFLGMLLVGTLLMASSIIPMTFQEPTSQKGLNIACMATPWLFVCGFATAFSAIFTKSWRISILAKEAVRMNRVDVQLRDVLLPFLMLMMTNVSFLTAWTVEAPLVWTRVLVDNYDTFGRSVETYGICKGQVNDASGADLSIIFISLIAVVNGLVMGVAYYQAYVTRHMPDDFKDSVYASLCMAIMLEALLLGFPIMFLVYTNPTEYFLLRVLVVAAFCIAILGTNFVPKLWIQHRVDPSGKHGEWRNFMARSCKQPAARNLGNERGRRGSVRVRRNSLPSSVLQLRARIAEKSNATPNASMSIQCHTAASHNSAE